MNPALEHQANYHVSIVLLAELASSTANASICLLAKLTCFIATVCAVIIYVLTCAAVSLAELRSYYEWGELQS